MAKELIKIDNLNVTYASGQHALQNVTLRLSNHCIYGLVGVNGAGKSTLFKSIMGFLKPQSGSIQLNGLSVSQALKKNLISYVPQTEDVDWNFPVLVEDVVMMGRYGRMNFLRIPSKADKKAVDEALERVDMTAFRERQIGELSGGQKKRVFVARALAQGGHIILLDEPFSGVDIKTENSLIELLKSLAKDGQLILVSTHNLGSVPAFCDQVILINKEVLAAGPVETTFTQKKLAQAFGGMLRHHQLLGPDLHDDEDARGVTVLTDDERPLVLYGEQGIERIVRSHKDKDD